MWMNKNLLQEPRSICLHWCPRSALSLLNVSNTRPYTLQEHNYVGNDDSISGFHCKGLQGEWRQVFSTRWQYHRRNGCSPKSIYGYIQGMSDQGLFGLKLTLQGFIGRTFPKWRAVLHRREQQKSNDAGFRHIQIKFEWCNRCYQVPRSFQLSMIMPYSQIVLMQIIQLSLSETRIIYRAPTFSITSIKSVNWHGCSISYTIQFE